MLPQIRGGGKYSGNGKSVFRDFIPVYSGYSGILFRVFRDIFKGNCMDPSTQILKLEDKCAKKWHDWIQNRMLITLISLNLGFWPSFVDILVTRKTPLFSRSNFWMWFIPDIPVFTIPEYSGPEYLPPPCPNPHPSSIPCLIPAVAQKKVRSPASWGLDTSGA